MTSHLHLHFLQHFYRPPYMSFFFSLLLLLRIFLLWVHCLFPPLGFPTLATFSFFTFSLLAATTYFHIQCTLFLTFFLLLLLYPATPSLVHTFYTTCHELNPTSHSWFPLLSLLLCNIHMLLLTLCYVPSSISVLLGCRGHICCSCVMLLFLVPVPGTFLLLSSSDIPLAIVPCNKIAPQCMPHGGLFPCYLLQP